jgi:hypothetical protein
MLRTVFVLGVILSLPVFTGCTLCCHPYDYCGPVYEGCEGQSCDPMYRAGSILSGSPTISQINETPQTTIEKNGAEKADPAASTVGQIRTGDVPGSERIVSVTERVVDSQGNPNGSTATMMSADPEAAPLRTQSEAKGWVASKPNYQQQR